MSIKTDVLITDEDNLTEQQEVDKKQIVQDKSPEIIHESQSVYSEAIPFSTHSDVGEDSDRKENRSSRVT